MHRSLVVLVNALAFASLGCTGTPGIVGDPCLDESDCEAGTRCITRPGFAISPVCMADCDPTTTERCEDGTVCIQRTEGVPDEGTCFLGGPVEDGGACDNTLDCTSGSVCVTFGGESTCARSCDPDGDEAFCGPLRECAELVGGGGFCRVM